MRPESSICWRRSCSLCRASFWAFVRNFPSFFNCSFFSRSFSFLLAFASSFRFSSSASILSSSSMRLRSSSSSLFCSSSCCFRSSCCFCSALRAAGIFLPFPAGTAEAAGGAAGVGACSSAFEAEASGLASSFARGLPFFCAAYTEENSD